MSESDETAYDKRERLRIEACNVILTKIVEGTSHVPSNLRELAQAYAIIHSGKPAGVDQIEVKTK